MQLYDSIGHFTLVSCTDTTVLVHYIINPLRPSDTNHHWFKWWPVAWMAPINYLYQCWNIVNWTLLNKFCEISIQILRLLLKIHLKMLSAKCCPFCLGLKMLSPVKSLQLIWTLGTHRGYLLIACFSKVRRYMYFAIWQVTRIVTSNSSCQAICPIVYTDAKYAFKICEKGLNKIYLHSYLFTLCSYRETWRSTHLHEIVIVELQAIWHIIKCWSRVLLMYVTDTIFNMYCDFVFFYSETIILLDKLSYNMATDTLDPYIHKISAAITLNLQDKI